MQQNAMQNMNESWARARANNYEIDRKYSLGSYNFPRSESRKDEVMARRVKKIRLEQDWRVMRRVGIAALILFGVPIAISALAWTWSLAAMSVFG